MIQIKYTIYIYILGKVDIITGRYFSDINTDGQTNVILQ